VTGPGPATLIRELGRLATHRGYQVTYFVGWPLQARGKPPSPGRR
jgi:hypothetical protein